MAVGQPAVGAWTGLDEPGRIRRDRPGGSSDPPGRSRHIRQRDRIGESSLSSKASLVWFLGIILIFVNLLMTKQGQNLLLMLWQPPGQKPTAPSQTTYSNTSLLSDPSGVLSNLLNPKQLTASDQQRAAATAPGRQTFK